MTRTRSTLASNPWTSASLSENYAEVRRQTELLAEPLAPEDFVVQSMPDVSPTKWHLAHTTWFFETFLLSPLEDAYRPVDPAYAFLFNSYYEGAGPRHMRSQRGLLSRPTVDQIFAYRRQIDERMQALLARTLGDPDDPGNVRFRVVIGLHHEQQHQELLLMDIKHVFSVNPMLPVYQVDPATADGADVPALAWADLDGGLVEIGHRGAGFAFDNETPRHSVFLRPFRIAQRLVTNREYIAFIEDGGYRRPDLWLADGWHAVQQNEWTAPEYWQRIDGHWHQFTLHGLKPADTAEPVVHVSFYEADAYARWLGHRLPTEAEWEVHAATHPVDGHFLGGDALHPRPASQGQTQVFGSVWEHTQSPYSPYPGFRPLDGTLGEYNGKFMCSQTVVRGGSCLTPQGHVRPTYRNFFYPHQRWCALGIRLASDLV